MLDNEVDKVEILPLSEDERRVLELYDRLQQLQLEVAVLNASQKSGKVSKCLNVSYLLKHNQPRLTMMSPEHSKLHKMHFWMREQSTSYVTMLSNWS